MKAQIGQWGNSLAFRIPKHIVEELSLRSNDAVECWVESGQLVIKPIHTLPELTLEDLLAETTDLSEETDWGQPQGHEVW